MMQQMGFGLAIAVFMDATIIRSILVPATMRLLGNKNWYLPKWLEWLPKVGIGEGGSEEVQPAKKRGETVPPLVPVPVPVPVCIHEDNGRYYNPVIGRK